jgi:hypothetical protein
MADHAGGCLCGAVRYVAHGEPLNVMICHCRLCRKATGQPVFARAIFPTDQVEIQGETRGYHSSEEVERRFCPNCGSGLFAGRSSRADRMAITLGSFDEPEALPPQAHIWASRRLAWMEHLDGIPSHAEFPAA